MKLSINETKINSMIVAIMLSSAMIAITLSLGFGLTSNANLMILIVVFALVVYEIIRFGGLYIKIRPEMIGLLVLVTALYGLSVCFSKYLVDYSPIQLFFYVFLPIIAVNLKFNVKLVCKYALYLSLFTIFAGDKFFEYQYSFINQANMGNIYPIVTMLTCALFHFRYYRNDSDTSQVVWLCYAYNAYMFVRTCMVGNRGALLSLLFTLFVLVIYDFNREGQMKRLGKRQIAIWSIACVLLIVVVLNMKLVFDVLAYMFDWLFGFVPSVILKMQRYIGYEDISNGRGPIYSIIFTAIRNSPIFGYGMRSFQQFTQGAYPYPHNFILQFLYEGGVLFAFVPVCIAIRALVRVMTGTIKNKDRHVMSAILVCVCYPKLLLSSDVWLGTGFWMLIMWDWILDKSR